MHPEPDVLSRELDLSSDRPVFRQIADHLREAIDQGRLPQGVRLPSEAQLMEHYGVARMTVRHAIQVLQTDGLAVAERGRGVFVRRRPPVRRLGSDRFARRHRKEGKAAFVAETEARGAKPTVDMLDVREEQPTAEVAERLRLGEDDKVTVRSRRYLMDGSPVETAVSYLPAAVSHGTPIADPNPGPGGIYARLEEYGHTLDHFSEEISSRMPTPEEVRTLGLAQGVPVFHLIRTAYNLDGRPLEVCDTVMAADAYVLAYELPAH